MKKITVSDSQIEGIGVLAAADIPRGNVVLDIDDSRVVTAGDPLDSNMGEFERHCDYLAAGKVVLMQYPERHINHSCDPNTHVQTIDGVRRVIALRDIRAGDEITYDYCINGFGDTVWMCKCGSFRCRHVIHSDFFHLPMELQKEYLPLLDRWYVAENHDNIDDLKKKISEQGTGD